MKSWQIFVFSLIPLALVFIGVIGGSFTGGDRQLEEFPTPGPQPTSAGPAPTAPANATVLEIVAQNIAFDKRSLTAAANQPVQLTLDNQDAGVLHNVSIYTDNRATDTIYEGELITGPTQITYDFDAPAAGNYFFRCDVHPDTMTGSFIVQ